MRVDAGVAMPPPNEDAGSCGDTSSDPHNCGACGHDCSGATCSNSVCESVVIAAAQVDAYALTVDDQNVYWTVEGTGSDGAVLKAPAQQTGTATAIASGQPYPSYITTDGKNVYWVAIDGVHSVSVNGGTSTIMAPFSTDEATAIAVDLKNVYYASIGSGEAGGSLFAVSLATATSLQIATQLQGQTAAVASNGSTVFYADSTDLSSVAPNGSNANTIEPGQYASAVTADAKYVYWTSGLQSGAILRAPVGGGSPVTLASNQFYPNAIAVDGANVYWTTGEGGGGTVMEVPINGGPVVTLASGQAYPTGIAINNTRVYWVNFGTGTINSAPK
jgi:hypothetical protein